MSSLRHLASSRTLLQAGPKMLTGLVLVLLGIVLSYPVFIGQHGNGTSWWPALILCGLSWFLLGCARKLASRLS